MIKVLFIAMHRKLRSPSQRFRFEQYFEILESQGIEYEFSYLISEKDDKVLYAPGNYIGKLIIFIKSWIQRSKDVKRADEFDYIFIQREAFMTGSINFEKKFANSKAKLIFDFDDSIWLRDKNEANRKLSFLKNPAKTAKIISLCDSIVAGNQYLADYAKQYNKNVVIIPTTIDTEWYKPKTKTDNTRIIIGWSGSFTTIKHFESAIEALTKIKAKYRGRISFKVIGDSKYHHEPLEIIGQEWEANTELEDLEDIDIGIMPLPNLDWTRGKCGLKGLQYMGLAIPTIMSPVGVNTEIIEDGVNGFLAETPDEWVDKLSQLIDAPELRRKLGTAGRETVVNYYSVEANKEKYLGLFE